MSTYNWCVLLAFALTAVDHGAAGLVVLLMLPVRSIEVWRAVRALR